MAHHGHPISNSFITTTTTITTITLVGKITGCVKVPSSFWILGKRSKSYGERVRI